MTTFNFGTSSLFWRKNFCTVCYFINKRVIHLHESIRSVKLFPSVSAYISTLLFFIYFLLNILITCENLLKATLIDSGLQQPLCENIEGVSICL